MTFLATPHVAAVVFFVFLVGFELVRRQRALALLRHPMSAYVARGALAAMYFAFAGIDPARWLEMDAENGVLLGIALALLVAFARRSDLASVAGGPLGMLAPAAFLAVVVAAVEELLFRGAFVLPAAVTPLATALAILGASIAYALWRVAAWRERSPRAFGLAFASSLALASVTALTRSLWPALLAHAAFAFLSGPPRSPTSAAR